MKHMVRNTAIAVLLLSILITAGCGNPPAQTTLTDSVNAASSKSANGLELSLSLDATTYKLYQDVSIVIDEKNTLSKTNRVAASYQWPLKGLTLGPCTQGSPFGVAVFSGYYSPEDILKGTPLVLFDPNQFYHCPAFSWAEGAVYEFKPLSDVAAIFQDSVPPSSGTDTQILKELQLSHYWTGSNPAVVNSFEPGVYTIVVGDEWGALVVLHFTVTNTDTTSLITITSSSQQPIEVISVSDTYKTGEPINPGGPTIEITLKNISAEPIISLAVTLDEGRPVNYPFDFGVTSANPLSPGETANAKRILIGGGFGGGISYSVIISGTYQDGSTFNYTWNQ